MRDGWEILTDYPRLNAKATRMIQAMVQAAPAGTVATAAYTGRRRGLMLYGPGSPTKLPLVQQHLQRGGQVAMWDLGYWDRGNAMRLSINALHPSAAQLAASPAVGRREFVLRQDADPDGPILLVGLGPKSVFAYGLGQAQAWERAKVKDLRRRFPDREILWRPKGLNPVPLLELGMRHGMPIEEALAGCSLLVCHHSNCSIDACIAGVPVDCEDGAAAALYRSNPAPTRRERADFLARLTWWEWSRFEAAAAWKWIAEVVSWKKS